MAVAAGALIRDDDVTQHDAAGGDSTCTQVPVVVCDASTDDLDEETAACYQLDEDSEAAALKVAAADSSGSSSYSSTCSAKGLLDGARVPSGHDESHDSNK